MKHTAYLYVYWDDRNNSMIPHVTDTTPYLGGPFHFVREIPIEIPDGEWTRAVDEADRKFLPDEDKT